MIFSPEYLGELKGGIATHVSELATGLSRLGCEVMVLAYSPNKTTTFRQSQVTVHLVAPGLKSTRSSQTSVDEGVLIFNRELVAHVRAIVAEPGARPDIVHFHNSPVYLAARECGRMFGVPVVGTVHSLSEPVARWWGQTPTAEEIHQEQSLCREADALITVSHSLRAILQAHHDVPDDRLHVIYNGMNLKPFLKSSYKAETIAKLRQTVAKPNEKIVIFVGRLNVQKGVPALCASASQVMAKTPDVRYLLVGEPDARESSEMVRQLFEQYPELKNKIKLLGNIPREQLIMLYQVADLAVVASIFEPCPYAAIEAMAAGVPVVATNVGGLAEIIQHDHTGLLVPVHSNGAGPHTVDVEQLAAAQVLLLSDGVRARQMGEAGQQRILSEFNLEPMVQSTFRVYQHTLRAFRARGQTMETQREEPTVESSQECSVSHAAQPGGRYDAIIPHATEPQVLLLSDENGWSLPHWAPGEQHFSAANHINRAIRDRFGLDATVLRYVHYDSNPDTKEVRAVYAMENHSPSWTPPAGARWIGRQALDEVKLAVPEHRHLLETWFAEAEGSKNLPALRAPWARTGWFDLAAAWIQDQLDGLSYTAVGPVEQFKTSAGSCILRVNTTAGMLYFKAVPTVFAREPVLTQALAERYPAHFVDVLAVDAGRHWMLMREVQATPLYLVFEAERWEEALRLFAHIQIDSVDRLRHLMALGCPDRRLDTLAAQIDPLLADLPAMRPGQPGGLTRTEIDQLHALTPRFKAMCGQLASFRVPPTLEHGDFHPQNISVTDQGVIYMDWSEASVAPPFFSLASIIGYVEHLMPDMRSVGARIRDAYLEPWTIYEPMDRLIQAFELSRPLAALHYARSLHRAILSREAGATWEIRELKAALPVCLKLLLHLSSTRLTLAP